MTVGSAPTDFTLDKYNGGQYSLSSSSGKIILFSFIDIIHEWNWLEQLVAIRESPVISSIYPADVEIVAVMYNHNDAGSEVVNGIPMSGQVIPFWISEKIHQEGTGPINFIIAANGVWTGSGAGPGRDYLGGFSNAVDPLYTGTAYNRLFSYIISKDYLICDKWNRNCSANGDPISFNRIDLGSGPGTFDSTDYAATGNYCIERITNLNTAPEIMYSSPASGSVIDELPTAEIVFSKPMDDGPVASTGNYSITGGGKGTLTLQSTNYSGARKAENAALISFTGNVTDSGADDTVRITLGSAVEDTEGNGLTGIDFVEYTVDMTGPSPTISSGESSPTNADPIPITITFNEAVNPSTFTESDVSVSNGSVDSGSLSTTDNIIWTADIIPTADGTVMVQIAAGVLEDGYGNSNSADSFSIVSDTTAPKPVISSAEPDPTDALSFDVTIDFGEEVNGFTIGDISVGNGTVTSLTSADNIEYTAEISPQAAGNVTVSVGAGCCHDLAGNLNLADTSSFSITYAPQTPVYKDVVLCMDYSNSMNSKVDIPPDPPASKISHMRAAIDQFIDEWNQFNDQNDSYGMVQYKSTAFQVSSGLEQFDAADMHAKIASLSASGNTAMGAGLAISLDMLQYDDAGYTNERAIVLFADGQSNVHPMVDTSISGQYAIDGSITGTGVPPGMGNIVVHSSDAHKIPIHTIGIGSAASWLGRMAHLSTVTGGRNYASETSQIWPLAAGDFEHVLEDIYPDSSPQVVYRHRDTLQPVDYEKTESFCLNRSCKKALFCVSWPGSTLVEMEVCKGDRPIIYLRNIISHSRYTIIVIDFPHFELNKFIQVNDPVLGTKVNFEELVTLGGRVIGYENYRKPFGTPIYPEGTWNIKVRRKGGSKEAPYNFSVIADEKAIKYHLQTPLKPVFTGQALQLGVNISELGHPLSTLYDAKVKITAPFTCFGNVLNEYLPQIKVPGSRELNISQRIDQQLKKIEAIPEARALLQRKLVSQVHMKPGSGLGNFVARIPSLKVPGIYRFDMIIRGYGNTTGVFQRTRSHTIYVRPNIHLPSSDLKRTVDLKKRILKIDIVPRDMFGNYLGPGFSEQVRTNFSDGDAINVQDHLNGRYTIEIKLPSNKKKLPSSCRITMFSRTILREKTEELLSE